LLKAFSFRSEAKPVWQIPLLSNLQLVIVAAASFGLQIWAHHNSLLSRFLKTILPPWNERWMLLDADLPENSEGDRALTHYLYGDGQLYRLCQEVILGIGGLRMLRALGYRKLQRFHMNEGHASLLGLELLDERARADGRDIFNHADVEAVRAQCVFTTHTPVPAGHDQFPLDLVGRVVGRSDMRVHSDDTGPSWRRHNPRHTRLQKAIHRLDAVKMGSEVAGGITRGTPNPVGTTNKTTNACIEAIGFSA
jgi:hypothetical protein